MKLYSVGDHVKVCLSVPRWGRGTACEEGLWKYRNSWVPEMHSSIGGVYTIMAIHDGGYKLCFDAHGRHFWFPESSLSKVDREVQVDRRNPCSRYGVMVVKRFKVGEYVTVTHSVREWGASRGFEVKLWDYGDTWVPDMNGAIGRQFTITGIESGGYRLCYELRGRTFRFPETCLQPADRKAAEKPEVTIWQ